MNEVIPRIEIKQNGPRVVIKVNGEELPGVFSYEVSQEAGNPLARVKLGLRTDKLTFESDSLPELPEAYKPYYKAIKEADHH